MKHMLLLLLRAYKYFISPLLGQNCRFFPSCADYASESIAKHGGFKGAYLAANRLCKCHPWHTGGLDPVPEKFPFTRIRILSAKRHIIFKSLFK